MGLREKVTLTLVIIIFVQIACRHCMPRTQKKASLKRYQDPLKPVKSNPSQTPFSPTRGISNNPDPKIGRKNAKLRPNPTPKKSLYQTYNFPENEYPLDNSPRDPIHFGINYNYNNQMNIPQNGIQNTQNAAINRLKKELKMKRKLSGNRQTNIENYQSNSQIFANNFLTGHDTVRLQESGIFPEVQYPLNTMETWVPNYWNYVPFTQEQIFHGIGQQKEQEISKSPFRKLTKTKANQFLKPYDKLKEEQRRKSTENSKRSNVGSKGLNFTKTETCEKLTDDFISASILSSISNTSDTKNELKLTFDHKPISESTSSPVTTYLYESVPIPYKSIDQNSENVCIAFNINNNTKGVDFNKSEISQSVNSSALLHNQAKLHDKDISSEDLCSPESLEVKTMTTSEYNFTNAPADDVRSHAIVPKPDELLLPVFEDFRDDNLQNNIPSLPSVKSRDNTSTIADSLDVRIPSATPSLNVISSNPSNMDHTNVNTVPGSTSILIIPINNGAVKSQSQFSENVSDSPIIVYIPSVSSPFSQNQLVSPTHDQSIPNKLNNFMSDIPHFNDKVTSSALVSEILTGIANRRSQLPMYKTLATNSMHYNNESYPTSFRVEQSSNNTINKSFTDNSSSANSTCSEPLSYNEELKESCSLDMNSNALLSLQNIELPVFDFPNSNMTLLKHELYNHIITNELPITTHETNQDHLVSDLQPVITRDYLQNSVSFFKTFPPNGMSEIPTNRLQIHTDNRLPPASISYTFPDDTVPPTDINPSPIPLSKPTMNLLARPIDKNILLTPILENLPDNPTILAHETLSSIPLSDISTNSLRPSIDKTWTLYSEPYTVSLPKPIHKPSPISEIITDSTTKSKTPTTKVTLTESLPRIKLQTDQRTPISVTSADSFSLLIQKMLPPTITFEIPTESLLLPIQQTLPLTPLSETFTDGQLPLPMDTIPVSNPAFESSSVRLSQSKESHQPFLIIENPSVRLTQDMNVNLSVNPVMETSINKPTLVIDKIIPPSLLSDTSTPYLEFPNEQTLPPDRPLIHSPNQENLVDHLPKQEFVLPMTISDTPNDSLQLIHKVVSPTKLFNTASEEVLLQTNRTTLTIPEGTTDNLPLVVDINNSQPSPPTPLLDCNTDSQCMAKFKHDTPLSTPVSGISFNSPILKAPNMLPQSSDVTLPETFDQLCALEESLNKALKQEESLPLPLDNNLSHTEQSNNLAGNFLSSKTTEAVSPIQLNEIHSDISVLGDTTDNITLRIDRICQDKPDILDDESNDILLGMLLLSNDKTAIPNNLPSSRNTTSSVSKLEITKTLLKKLLSFIDQDDFYLPISEAVPDTETTRMKKVQLDTPYSETDEDPPPLALGKNILNPRISVTVDDLPQCKITETVLQVPLTPSKIPSDELLLPIDHIRNYKPNIVNKEEEDTAKKAIKIIANNTNVLTLTVTPPPDLPVPKNKTHSALKLLKTKALLENVLSDITQDRFSLPLSKSILVENSHELSEFLHSDRTEESLLLPDQKNLLDTDLFQILAYDCPLHKIKKDDLSVIAKELPLGKSINSDSKHDLQLPFEKMHKEPDSDVVNDKEETIFTNILNDSQKDLPLPRNNISPSSKLQITKRLLQNLLSNMSQDDFSVLLTEILSDIPIISIKKMLSKSLHYDEITKKNLSLPTDSDFLLTEISKDNMKVIVTETPTDMSVIGDLIPDLQSPLETRRKESTKSHTKDVKNDDSDKKQTIFSNISNNSQIDLPVPRTKIPSPTKLQVTKKLLTNLLFDMSQDDFSSSLTEILSSIRTTLSKKALSQSSHYEDITKKSLSLPGDTNSFTKNPDNSTQTLHLSKKADNVVHMPTDEILSDPSLTDITKDYISVMAQESPAETSILDLQLPIEMIGKESPDRRTDAIEDNDMQEIIFCDMSNDFRKDLPQNNTPSLSKLQIAKILLENLLFDMSQDDFTAPLTEDLSVIPITLLQNMLSQSHYDTIAKKRLLPGDKNNFRNDPHNSAHTLHLSKRVDNVAHMSKDEILSDFPVTEMTKDDMSVIVKESPADTSLNGDSIHDSQSSSEKMRKEAPDNRTDDGDDGDKEEIILTNISNVYQKDLLLQRNNTPSLSKLQITKALLDKILSDMSQDDFVAPLTELLSVIPITSLQNMLSQSSHYDDIAKKSLSLPRDSDFPLTEVTKDDMIVTLKESPSDILVIGHPIHDLQSPLAKMRKEASDSRTYGVEYGDKEETTFSNISNDFQKNLIVPHNNTPPLWKLQITKELLENLLFDMSQGDFSTPLIEILSTIPTTLLKKALTQSSQYEDIPKMRISLPRNGFTKYPDNSAQTLYVSKKSNNIVHMSKDRILSDFPLTKITENDMSVIVKESPTDTSLNGDPTYNLQSQFEKMRKEAPDSLIDGVGDIQGTVFSNMLNYSHKDLPLQRHETPSFSKLQITKGLLQKILLDMSQDDFSVPLTQVLSTLPTMSLQKALLQSSHYDDSTKKSLSLPGDKKIFKKTSDHPAQTLHLSKTADNVLNMPNNEVLSELNNNTEDQALSVNKMQVLSPEILTDEVENKGKKEVKFSQDTEDTLDDFPLTTNKITADSKVIKALLENVLSEITQDDFLTPIAKALPATSLHKRYPENLNTNIDKDSLPLQEDKSISNTELLENLNNSLPISGISDKVLPIPVDGTHSYSLNLNNSTDHTQSPMDNIHNIKLMNIIEKEDDETTIFYENLTNTQENLLLPRNKSPIASKLQVTKTLLENVLSDITKENFSVPISKGSLYTNPTPLKKPPELSHFDGAEISTPGPLNKVPSKTELSEISAGESSYASMLSNPTNELRLAMNDDGDVDGGQPLLTTYGMMNDLSVKCNRTTSTSKLKISKVLLESLLSDITQEDFAIPISEVLVRQPPTSKTTAWKSSQSDVIEENLPSVLEVLPDHTILPENKAIAASKLPILKALLGNVLSDIREVDLSSQLTQSLRDTPFFEELSMDNNTPESPLLSMEKTNSESQPSKVFTKDTEEEEFSDDHLGYVG